MRWRITLLSALYLSFCYASGNTPAVAENDITVRQRHAPSSVTAAGHRFTTNNENCMSGPWHVELELAPSEGTDSASDNVPVL